MLCFVKMIECLKLIDGVVMLLVYYGCLAIEGVLLRLRVCLFWWLCLLFVVLCIVILFVV